MSRLPPTPPRRPSAAPAAAYQSRRPHRWSQTPGPPGSLVCRGPQAVLSSPLGPRTPGPLFGGLRGPGPCAYTGAPSILGPRPREEAPGPTALAAAFLRPRRSFCFWRLRRSLSTEGTWGTFSTILLRRAAMYAHLRPITVEVVNVGLFLGFTTTQLAP